MGTGTETDATPWASLIAQNQGKAVLQSALRSGRMANGFLFEGPAGVGKRTGAAVLAQVLLCHQPPTPDTACGNCKSCLWMSRRNGYQCNHPDLLYPLKRDSKKMESLVGDQEPGISIETVQMLCEKLHKGPLNGPKRVAIVPEAHRLCRGRAEAANAFLKTLEEPPQSSIIILTSNRPEALLDTIISRVQTVRFTRLGTKDIERGLQDQTSATKDAIALAARLGDGSLGRALELLEGDLSQWRGWVAKALGAFGPKHCPAFGLALWKLAEEEGKRLFAAETEKGRDSTRDEIEDEADESSQKTEAGWIRYVFGRLLELIEISFRDGMVKAAGASVDNLIQKDALDTIEALAKRFGVGGCEKVLESLREARFAIRLYVRGDLVGRVLSGQMVEALD